MADCVATSSEPEAAFRAALLQDPFDAASLHGLGCLLLNRGRPAEATALLSAAASTGPSAAILSDLGLALAESKQAEEAECRLRQAATLDPLLFRPQFNLGRLLLSRDMAAALDAFRTAQALAPSDDTAILAIAGLLIDQGNAGYAAGDMAEAERLYHEASTFKPDLAAAHANLGNALTMQLRLPEALAAYRTALDLAPGDDGAAFAYSLCLLLSGDEAAGWPLFERRRGVPQLLPDHTRRPELPQWHPGMSLAGSRVLVTAEQGAGDLIQYARFVPALARSAAKVMLEMPWPMATIFADLPGVAQVVTMGDPTPDCDIACPLLSLPLLCGPNAGIPPPYIPTPDARLPRWTAWLERASPGMRVGLVSSGDPRHPHDRWRSVPLADFAPLLALPDISYVLVQSQIRDTDRAAFRQAENLRCPAAALTDYADTAALLSGLDLVISVDTSIAHLAGAMGLPVWTLLPYCPDYRWKLDRHDTHWYSSMRLYRQHQPGDWATVIERVRADLASD